MSKKYIEQAVQTLSNQWHGDKVANDVVEATLLQAIVALKKLDAIKKALFYGKPSQDYVLRHINDRDDCQNLPDWFGNRTLGETTIHGILGIATEAGELLEALFNVVIVGSDADKVNIKEELGDVFWYQAILAKFHGFTFEEVQDVNIAKLRKRFPDGFKAYDAINRDLMAEREVLEGEPKLYTTDAQKWAQAFMAIVNEQQVEVDEGFMIGWFANAIETAKDIERDSYEFKA